MLLTYRASENGAELIPPLPHSGPHLLPSLYEKRTRVGRRWSLEHAVLTRFPQWGVFPLSSAIYESITEQLKNWGHLQGEKICFPGWKSSQTMDLLICPMTNWTGKRIQEDWPNREQAALGEHLSRLFSRTRRWELREQKNIEGSSTGAILCASLHGDQVRGPYYHKTMGQTSGRGCSRDVINATGQTGDFPSFQVHHRITLNCPTDVESGHMTCFIQKNASFKTKHWASSARPCSTHFLLPWWLWTHRDGVFISLLSCGQDRSESYQRMRDGCTREK